MTLIKRGLLSATVVRLLKENCSNKWLGKTEMQISKMCFLLKRLILLLSNWRHVGSYCHNKKLIIPIRINTHCKQAYSILISCIILWLISFNTWSLINHSNWNFLVAPFNRKLLANQYTFCGIVTDAIKTEDALNNQNIPYNF